MSKFSFAFLAIIFVIVLTGCPSKPTKFSDPDKAKANAERGMDEMDHEMRKNH